MDEYFDDPLMEILRRLTTMEDQLTEIMKFITMVQQLASNPMVSAFLPDPK